MNTSRYSIVYPLQRKSNAEEKISEYYALFKNLGASVVKFFSANGIVVQRTAPYSSQQNGGGGGAQKLVPCGDDAMHAARSGTR